MTLKAKVANALSFAQMAGLGRSKAAKAEEEDEKKKEDAKKAEDSEDEAKAKAEGDDEEKKDDEDEKESKKATKAEKDDEDDEDEDDEKKESKAKAAASAERARCKAIVAHGVKTGQVVHACAYAFDTDMAADAAVATLDANLSMQQDKPQGSSLRERMAAVETPVVKPEADAPESGSPAAIAQMVIAAAAKARGEKS